MNRKNNIFCDLHPSQCQQHSDITLVSTVRATVRVRTGSLGFGNLPNPERHRRSGSGKHPNLNPKLEFGPVRSGSDRGSEPNLPITTQSQPLKSLSGDPQFLIFTHWTMALKRKSECSIRNVLVIDTALLQSRSLILTATLQYSMIHSRCTLDLIRSTSLASTISPKCDGCGTNCHKRNMTLRCPLRTAPRRSPFRT